MSASPLPRARRQQCAKVIFDTSRSLPDYRRCENLAIEGGQFCRAHDPAYREQSNATRAERWRLQQAPAILTREIWNLASQRASEWADLKGVVINDALQLADQLRELGKKRKEALAAVKAVAGARSGG